MNEDCQFRGTNKEVIVMKWLNWRLRTALLAIALLSVPLGTLCRPYPQACFGSGLVTFIHWSDGTSSHVTHGQGRTVSRWRESWPITGVVWSDGSTSWHFTRPIAWLSKVRE